jgi:hypothetical protein
VAIDSSLTVVTFAIIVTAANTSVVFGGNDRWTNIYMGPERYVKFLPDRVALPTTWTEHERHLLKGTSLATVNHSFFCFIRSHSSGRIRP